MHRAMVCLFAMVIVPSIAQSEPVIKKLRLAQQQSYGECILACDGAYSRCARRCPQSNSGRKCLARCGDQSAACKNRCQRL